MAQPLLQRRPTRPPPLTRILHKRPSPIELQRPPPVPAQPLPECPLARALFSPPIQPRMCPPSQDLLTGWHEVRSIHTVSHPYPDVKAKTLSSRARQRARTKTFYGDPSAPVVRRNFPENASLMTDVSVACPTMPESQTLLLQTMVHPIRESRKSHDATESPREPVRDIYKPSHEELTLLEEFEECMGQDAKKRHTQAREKVRKDIRSSTEIVSVDEQRNGSDYGHNRYPSVGLESLLDSRTDGVASVPMKPPPPPSPATKYLVSVGYLTPPPTPPTPPEDSAWKFNSQNMRATSTKDFSPSKPKHINSYDTEAVPVNYAGAHCQGDPTVSSTVSMSPLKEPAQSTGKAESPGVSTKDSFQKPRMFSRKGKYLAPLFKKAPEGFPAVPPDYEVDCFLCNRSASGNRVYEHMFFGNLECGDCALILRSCEEFKVVKNRKGECRGSKGTHRFSQWADCPVEYLSYCVGESLAKTESGHGPPSTSDVARELGKYLRKLSLLRCFKPWKTAYRQCKEFVNSNATPVSDDVDRRLQNTEESQENNSHVLSSSAMPTQLNYNNQIGFCADTEVESITKDNNIAFTSLPEKVKCTSNTTTSQISDSNENRHCADIEEESTQEDNDRPSSPLVERETIQPNAVSRTERLECYLPETHSIDQLDSIVTYMAVDDNGEVHIVNNKSDDSQTVRRRNSSCPSPDDTNEDIELTRSPESHDSSPQTKEHQNTAFETPRKASFIDTKDSNYLVYNFPSQKGPEECPMCYCVLCPSMFTVDAVTFVVSAKCPDCELRIYIVFNGKEGSGGEKSGKKRRRRKEIKS